MKQTIDLKNTRVQKIHKLSDRFCGTDAAGNEIAFTNYYLTVNGKPYYAISGECHYSRVHEDQWEDTILKMKMGGINVISTYCFWNHHEEVEGVFRFDGNRNVRKFLELCKKHGMYVIVRIGPFDHGEVRNGGFPDWIYGKDFEVRSLDEGFLNATRKLYHAWAEQFRGLYFKDGGPIIGTQIENEYMHSASPWEMTTGITNEWVPGGSDGAEYMKRLKQIAIEEGIDTPFYTSTGWGGAAADVDEMLPLWGGYAFWPWIFYDYRGPHPLTPEYIYRDNHNNQVPKTYNFEPVYNPEDLPYACCEMGGGMACYYHYRFQLPYESVDAMANVKLAGGCNFLGYYMYRGGSNPKGEKNTFLNECQCPKISYDYQAAIGEYGQLRPSYDRLKPIHCFAQNFETELCDLVTVLPENSQEIKPEDQETLRFAVRTDGKKGFVFLNNYQDHCECKDKKGETIVLEQKDGDIVISDIGLDAGEEAVLPFGMQFGPFRLRYAKAQLLSKIEENGKTTFFFFVPKGMSPEYQWEYSDSMNMKTKDSGVVCRQSGQNLTVLIPSDHMTSYVISNGTQEVQIITLTREQSLMYYEWETQGKKQIALYQGALIPKDGKLYLENPEAKTGYAPGGDSRSVLMLYPKTNIEPESGAEITAQEHALFDEWELNWNPDTKDEISIPFESCGFGRYRFRIPEHYEDCKDARLRIRYQGDVGHLFVNGELLSDNFCNGDVWEVGLKEVWKPEMENKFVIYITPQKVNSEVNVSSTMAGRMEQMSEATAVLQKVSIQKVRETVIRL